MMTEKNEYQEELSRQGLLDKLRERGIDEKHCFLCGEELPSGDKTREHVIPRWAQDRYGLWDERLTLLNRTRIPYRQLTVPCCPECNNTHLSKLEGRISQAVCGGPGEVSKLPERDIFLWLTKILYGILYRETLLWGDRSDPTKGPIVEADYLRIMEMFHYCLQGLRLEFDFPTGVPASIFVFDVLTVDDYPYGEWDLRTAVPDVSMAIKMGNVGIVALLQDGRAQKDLYGDYLEDYQGAPIHPLQFLEITAKAFYKNNLLKPVPKFLLAETGEQVTVIQHAMGGMAGMIEFEEWVHRDFASLLSQFVGGQVPFVPPDKVYSWLKNENGTVLKYRAGEFLPVEEESMDVSDTQKSLRRERELMDRHESWWSDYTDIEREAGTLEALRQLASFVRDYGQICRNEGWLTMNEEPAPIALDSLAEFEAEAELLLKESDPLEPDVRDLLRLGLGVYRLLVTVEARFGDR